MIDLPFLPAALWLIAAGCLIVLILVLFGYHVYQRGRLRALAGDSASVSALAAKKEMLEAEVAEMRQWLTTQQEERLKLEAERRKQELARVDMAQLEKRLAEKRQEGQAIMTRMADLDMALARRKQFQTRLEAEIRSLEAQREELEPMEKYLRELRLELDQGKIRMAQLAQEELRAQSLQAQAQLLKREVEELKAGLEPLRLERERLLQYVDQARYASAVKNEQLLDQKRELALGEKQIEALARKNDELAKAVETAEARHAEAAAALDSINKAVAARQREGEDLRQAVFAEQTQLEMLIKLREACEMENSALAIRKETLALELETLQKSAAAETSQKRRARKPQPRLPKLRVGQRKKPLSVNARPQLMLAEKLAGSKNGVWREKNF